MLAFGAKASSADILQFMGNVRSPLPQMPRFPPRKWPAAFEAHHYPFIIPDHKGPRLFPGGKVAWGHCLEGEGKLAKVSSFGQRFSILPMPIPIRG